MVETPILAYDGDCGVCTDSARWIAARADIEIRPFTALDDSHLDELPDDWRRCAHLFTPDGVVSCGKAMEEAYLMTDHWGSRPLSIIRRIPGFGYLREFCYRLFASNRSVVGRIRRR